MGSHAADPPVPAELPGLRGRARPGAPARAGGHLWTQRSRQIHTPGGRAVDTLGQVPDDQGADPFGGRRRGVRHRGGVRARGSSLPGAPQADRGQLHAAAGGPLRRIDHVRGGARRRAATSSRCWGWTTPPSGLLSSPSRGSCRPSPIRRRPSASGWSSACSASPPSTRPETPPAATPAKPPPTTTACGGCSPTSTR